MSWTQADAKKLVDRIFSYSRAPECEVAIDLERTAHTRFAVNDITTAGSATDLVLIVTSRGGGKSGTTRVSDADPAAVKAAVARSEALMRSASVDPEFVAGLPRQKYPEIKAYFDETAGLDPAARARGVKTALDLARESKLTSSGFFETTTHWSAIANKKGNFCFHALTDASFSTTMRTQDGSGSGWAGFDSPRVSEIRAEELSSRAARKARSSAQPRELAPGKYTLVLEPAAVAELLASLGGALSARLADEGRSFFSQPGGGNRIGEKLFAEMVTLRSDPFDPRVPDRPWAGGGGPGGGGGGGGFLGFGGFGGGAGGLPARQVTWIEKGVVKALPRDRYWARRTGQEPLPFSRSLILEGGSGTMDAVIAGTERGLLVTRFWYIRTVNPQKVQLTGLTRDGLWLVEKGQITTPVNNFRFNESPINLLKNVEAMSAPIPSGRMVVPAMRVRDFNFTSRSDAV